MSLGVVKGKVGYLIAAGFLAAGLSVFFVYGIIEIGRLKDKIKSLDSAIVKSRDECEERIALIKAGKNEPDLPDTSSGSRYKERPRFKLNLEQSPKGIPDGIKKGLSLTDEQAEKASAALRDYQRTKVKIYGRVSKGDGNFNFGSFEYLQELETAVGDVHRKFRDIFSEHQYNLMMEKGYDQRLGIRIPEKGAKKQEDKKSEPAQPQSGGTETK